MTNQEIIEKTAKFVQETLKEAEAGHDWWHILRVWNNAKHIAEDEKVNSFIVELGVLLHDIADSKFHDGDEEIGPRTAQNFLLTLGVESTVIEHVVNITRYVSFKSTISGAQWMSPELAVVQDADRLDAIGAIGIARAFTFGGYTGHTIYNPEIPPNLHMTKEERKRSNAPTINHFYEKLFLLKDLMNTETGKKMAEERHSFMEAYLDQFYAEWEGRK
jgi:uncharacterized protein